MEVHVIGRTLLQRGLQGPTQWSNQTTVRLPQAECILDLGSELVSGLWPSTLAVNEISNPAQLQGERPEPSFRAESVALSGRKRFPSGAFLSASSLKKKTHLAHA